MCGKYDKKLLGNIEGDISLKVNRVEQHIIKKSNPIYQTIDDYCYKSKNLYNYANYIIRQEFINNGKWIRHHALDKTIQKSEPYIELGSQASQKTLELLDKNYKSFFASIKDWSKNPSKYLGKPRLPKYKDKNGRNPLLLKNIQCHINDGILRFSWKPLNQFKFKTNIHGKLMQVRFIPKGTIYVMEIVYEIEVPDTIDEISHIIGIDLGIDNFATISNNIGVQPIIINGKSLKSMNQFYNKRKAEIQSNLKLKHNKLSSNKLQAFTQKRNNKVSDFLHNASKTVVKFCVDNNIDTVVIGKNDGWKQESNMGKRNNQNFVQIPYETFINQIKYKCENYGIKTILTEESYTSGTSFLDNELPTKQNYNKSRRITRGLFKSNKGVEINADLNGAYQIIRKVFPNAFADGIEGVGLHPVRWNVV